MSEQRKEYKIDGRPSTIYRVVKNKDNPYVMIDRRPVDNPSLSFKAKGILTYLLSRPDGWEVSVADLIKHGTEGEAAVRSGLKELKEAGHMRYTQSRNQGRITGWLIEVFEVPIPPDRDFQQVENLNEENRTQVLKELNKKPKKTLIKAATPKQTTPEEVKLFREVKGRYPSKDVYEVVVQKIQQVNKRLLRAATKDDLKPFWLFWRSKGYNPENITWLDWAVSGVIPQNGKVANVQEPKGFTVAQQWLAKRQAVSNGD